MSVDIRLDPEERRLLDFYGPAGKPPQADAVKRPAHYRIFDPLAERRQVETIDIVELVSKHYPAEIAGHIMQALQYLCRAPHKGTMQEDMAKAERYLTRAINLLAGKPSWDRQG